MTLTEFAGSGQAECIDQQQSKKYMISASLVLYNTNLADLKCVLDSVLNSVADVLYIIDNSPTDSLAEFVSKYDTPRFEYIHGHGNIGYGKANNIGIERAMLLGSKYHIVLNPDIIFEREAIAELAGYMDANDSVGQILPKVVFPNGDLQHLCKLLPSPIDIFARRFLPLRYYKKRNARYEMHFMGYDVVWNCPVLSGCFMFLRVSALKEVGLFDERFFMYFEDFDLMRRMHMKYETVFYPYVSIIHNYTAGHKKNPRLFKESFKSAIKYFNKWGWFFDSQRKSINKAALKGH